MTLKPIFLITLLTLTTASLAHAHAFLDHANPRVGSTLTESPAQVQLWMTEDLEAAFSRIQVFDGTGDQIDKKDSAARGAILTVSLPKLKADTYRVSWIAVATDTHKTSGNFSFTLK